MATTASCLAEELPAGTVIQIERPDVRQKRLYHLVKRVFDAVCALLGLLLLALPMLLIALIVALDSPGPAIFRQERLGLNGKPFMIYKFRTMRLDAEANGPRWAAVCDTENYREFFQKVVTQRGLWYAVQHTSFEPLFTALTFLLSRLTRDPQILFVVTALFSFAVSGRFFARYSQAPCFSLYLFFTLQIFDFYISGIRQAIAIAVLLLAYEALDKGHNVRSLLLILLAGLFHRTAWLWFPVFFLLRIRRRRTFVWVTGLSGMVCLVGARYLVRVIAAIVPRYQLYFGSSYLQSGAKLSLMLYFLVFGLMLLVGELLRGQGDVSVQGERDFRLSSLLLLVCILGYTAPIFSRFLQYFQLNLCVYFANRLHRMPDRTRRLLLPVCLLAFAVYDCTIHLLRTPEWYTTYPFVFCWSP